MSAPQQPIDLDPAPESVVEFGSPPPEKRRRWQAASLPADWADDRRLVPVTAALAGVAAFASLISEWQLTTVDRSVLGGEGPAVSVPTETADLGVLGTGYLLGLFGMTAAVVLTMFGPPAGRRYARLIGLSMGGVVGGMVLALGVSLGDQSRLISGLYSSDVDEGQLQMTYGRGLWCALAAILFALLALYLAGRHLPAAGAVAVADEEDDDEGPTAVWSWRRPSAGADEDYDRGDPEPLELTVSPTKPFTPTTDDRDQPRS